MRDLIVSENITADGVIEAETDWFGPSGSEQALDTAEMARVQEEQRDEAESEAVRRRDRSPAAATGGGARVPVRRRAGPVPATVKRAAEPERERRAVYPAAMTTGTFRGFSDETLEFYAGLEADNSRTYWQDHREVYERAVHAPMVAMLDALEPEFGPAKLFRPYRDVRFSADKSPYKVHLGALVAHPGDTGSWYVQISATGLMLGGGLFHLAKDQLARYRSALAADRTGKPFAATVSRLTKQGWTVIGDALVRVPRGIDPDHPRGDLLRHKSIALTVDHGDPDWFTTPQCTDVVAQGWRAISPFLAWLGTHVGPADEASA
jgi:uncharacterized protein (TIGR02453 family)